MYKITKVYYIFLIFQFTNVLATVKTLDIVGTYISMGYNLTYNFGKNGRFSYGPEVALGTVYKTGYLVSVAAAYEKFSGNKDWAFKSKFQGGFPIAGSSIGPIYGSFKGNRYFGFETDFWVGLGMYGMVTYKYIPKKMGLSASGKLKIPIPFRVIHGESIWK